MANASERPQWRTLDGVLLLDKPLGLSSNQALQRVRRLFRAEKAGHTGSLDPLATGMLPICFGQATKLCGYLLDADKHYRATVRLGVSTTTGDGEGEITGTSDPAILPDAHLSAVFARFCGEIQQVPPMYSALKVQGRRLYELARAKEEVHRQARTVRIHHLELVSRDAETLVLDVHCSKGTYIRTLVEDMARAVGQCAHLSGLRRTALAPFGETAMVGMEALEALESGGRIDSVLLPLGSVLPGWPRQTVNVAQARCLAKGQAVPVDPVGNLRDDRLVAVFNVDGRLLGIAEQTPAGPLQPRRWLSEG